MLGGKYKNKTIKEFLLQAQDKIDIKLINYVRLGFYKTGYIGVNC